MKRSEHICITLGCEHSCPREYPFCASCWRRVPADERKAVRDELAKRGTSDIDRAALYYAVSRAAASVCESDAIDSVWERAYKRAGQPEL